MKYLLLLVLFTSCSINGSFQGLFSYQEKVEKSNPGLIQKAKDSICNITNPEKPTVYKINGQEIRTCIATDPKALIYIWRPNCSSKICVPLEILQDLCNQNDIELYIVSEYYDSEKMSYRYNVERPVFGIDTNYYKSDLTKKYVKGFIRDVTDDSDIDSDNSFMFYFEHGDLVSSGADWDALGL